MGLLSMNAMTDFTLIIPTYNRPAQLGALLRYLKDVSWNILVLDSSPPPTETQFIQGRRGLSLMTYPQDTHPFDKFADGVNRVTTEYCSILADDDLIVPGAVEPCLNTMRKYPIVVATQGNAFAFRHENNGAVELTGILRMTESIVHPAPLVRLAKLFGNYRAITYGIYRTDTLRKVLAGANQMPSILGRELLAAGLTAIEGAIINLPCLSHGRDGAPATNKYQNWHPLEWLVKDADAMMEEYTMMREHLIKALNAAMTLGSGVGRCLDLIFWRYLYGHFPPKVTNYLIEELTTKAVLPTNEHWPEDIRKAMNETVAGEASPILSSDALAEAQDCLRLYSLAMGDTSKDVHTSEEAANV